MRNRTRARSTWSATWSATWKAVWTLTLVVFVVGGLAACERTIGDDDFNFDDGGSDIDDTGGPIDFPGLDFEQDIEDQGDGAEIFP